MASRQTECLRRRALRPFVSFVDFFLVSFVKNQRTPAAR